VKKILLTTTYLSIISASLMAETFNFTCKPPVGFIGNSFSTTGTIDKDTKKGILKNLQLDDGMGNNISYESLDVEVVYDDYDMRYLSLKSDKNEFQLIYIKLFQSYSNINYNGIHGRVYDSFCTKN